jgi:hypothetical protein
MQTEEDKRPYPKRNSNPRSQRPSDKGLCLRPRGHWYECTHHINSKFIINCLWVTITKKVTIKYKCHGHVTICCILKHRNNSENNAWKLFRYGSLCATLHATSFYLSCDMNVSLGQMLLVMLVQWGLSEVRVSSAVKCQEIVVLVPYPSKYYPETASALSEVQFFYAPKPGSCYSKTMTSPFFANVCFTFRVPFVCHSEC